MTVEELNEFRAVVKEEIGHALASHPSKDEMQYALDSLKGELNRQLATRPTKDEMQHALDSFKRELKGELALRPTKDEMQQALQANKDETIEAMRDMQTEILRGIERFARGNFSRFHTIETTQADVNTRLG